MQHLSSRRWISAKGPFNKYAIETNLKKIVSACFSMEVQMSLQTSTFRLIVYGGVYPNSGVLLDNAFQKAFNVELNQNTWSEVGAIPFTKNCLSNPKVRHNRMDEDDPGFNMYCDIQSQNDYAMSQLVVMGYGGDVLRAQFCPDKIREQQALLASVMVEATLE